jgi:hypothetical protein
MGSNLGRANEMITKKSCNHLILTVLLIILSTPHNVFAEESQLIINGRPFFKIEGHSDGAVEQKLSKAKGHEYRVIISKIGNKYFWITRDRKELVPVQSGAYLRFISLGGSGYIKVSLLDNTYMEHIHLGLSNITYWGKVEDLNLK